MKFTKMLVSTSAVTVLMAMTLGGLSMPASAQLTIQSEEAAHPYLVKALHEMNDALRQMQASKDDFGGNKLKAIRDTQAAIHSLRKALYYRLNMDDQAIDRMQ
jgi:hypothetical protein